MCTCDKTIIVNQLLDRQDELTRADLEGLTMATLQKVERMIAGLGGWVDYHSEVPPRPDDRFADVPEGFNVNAQFEQAAEWVDYASVP